MNHSPFNATRQLETADSLERLWAGLFANYALPSKRQFLTWASMSSEDTLVYAFNRASRKLDRESMTPDQLGRYISGIARNERENRHVFPPKEKHAMSSDNQTTTTTNPTTDQLLDAVKASEPSATRDLAIDLLESGAVNADSSIADLGTAVERHYAPKQ